MHKRWFAIAVFLLAALPINAQDRGLGNPESVFIDKGTCSVGLVGGYNSWTTDGDDGYSWAGILKGLKGDVSVSDVSVAGSYFFRDNMSFGIRVGYSNIKVALDSLEMLSADISSKHFERQAISGALFCRDYIPLFDSRILAMFVEGRLAGTWGYSKDYDLTEKGKEGKYDRIMQASCGIYPGISVFATDRISFEMSLPLLECGCNLDRQENGQDYSGSLKRTFINFKPSLTGIRMGLVFHFN